MESVPGISVLIMTRDEEANIGECLRSVAFSDDVIVLDSLSEDRTVEIATTWPNVRVVRRAFDDWSTHQNWAMRHAGFRHPWVLQVDADERVSDRLREQLGSACRDVSYAAFSVERRDYFRGRWLKHTQPAKTLVRLFRPELVRFQRLVNPVPVIEGRVGQLNGWLDHYPFSKGIEQWLARHNAYSTQEALELRSVRRGRHRPIRELLAADEVKRRAALKDLFYRFPFRPQIKWTYYVFVRQAWLDGRAGLAYARLVYLYEYMISVKAEAQETQR